MLSNLSKYNFLLLLLISLVHCTVDKTYRPEDLPDSLYIRGHIDPSEGVEVLVTRAVSTSDTVYVQDLLVKNAVVTLITENGTRFNVPRYTASRYHLDTAGIPIVAGKQFRIEVSTPGLDMAISNWVVMPELIELDTLFFEADGGMNGSIPTGSGFIEFKENVLSSDYYIFRMLGQLPDGGLTPTNDGFVLPQSCETPSSFSEHTFNDGCLTGFVNIRGELFADLASYDVLSSSNILYTAAFFDFGRVSPEYEAYLFSLDQPEGWENGLVEPKPAYSNINNGLGVFYASNTKRRVISL